MTKRRSTKRALLTSVLSLFLCFAMLLGTTFAWFTDNVSSANNIIMSGNLDIELYHTNSYITDEKVDGLTDLFTVEEGKTFLWEPGAVVWENFKVANEGALALKYQLLLNFTNATETAPGSGKTLADVLKVAVVNGGFSGTRDDAKTIAYNYSLSTFALEGAIEAGAASDVYGVVIYWQPTANDNDYNVTGGLKIDLGVNLFATQLAAEEDSFGPEYDANAPMPEAPSTSANVKDDGSASMEVDAAPSATTNKTNVDAPAGAFEPTDKVELEVETTNTLFDVSAAGSIVASLDITMKVNGEETSADLSDGKVYTVTTYISKGLSNVSVTYTGTDGKAQPTNITYDAVTGKLTFQTNHFSNYAVTGEALAYDVENDTAIADIADVVEAVKAENSTVIIPEVNAEAIEEAIENSDKLSDEEKEAAANVTAAAKIGNENYATLGEAFAAANDGDTIVVLNNVLVNADTAITVTKTITLDLNGKTLAGVSTLTGANRSLIIVNNGGDMTVKNGTVTMEHKGANMGWNNSTNALEAVSGGKLTLDTVHVKNLGGSDMAYAVNIANNGGATLKTIKSTIESVNYVALRIFNNADGVINVDLTEGSKLIGEGSPFFVHFWTEADLGANQAARQAYLNVNFNNTEVSRYNGSKSLVRFGFTDAIYYSSTAMTEVVAGNANALVWAFNNNKNVLVNNDITLTNSSLVVSAGAEITLDLNGKTISQNKVQNAAYAMIAVKGTLNIKDSVGNGKLSFADVTEYTNDPGWASNTIRNEGILNVYSGTIENVSSDEVMSYGYPHAIDAYQGSVTNIYGGTVKSANYDSIRMFCNSTTLATTVNISGGTIINRISFQNPNNNTPGYGVLNISGGEFITTGNVNANVRLLNFSRDCSNMKATVTGGNFDKGFKTQDYANSGVKLSDWLSYKDATFVETAEELKSAITNAKDGDKIIIAKNITVTDKWDNRYGGRTDKAITIDGFGNTLKFTGEVNDGLNFHAVFRFTGAAVVKNLTFDFSEAKAGTYLRAISATSDLAVDNCTFIGSDNYTRDNAIMFGDTNDYEQIDASVSITNCTFINWRRGISDNENAKEVKSVVVSGNTFKDANAYISVYENVTFTDNNMDNSLVNITSYTNAANVKVVVTGNALDASNYNVIGSTSKVFGAANVTAQEGIVVNAK